MKRDGASPRGTGMVAAIMLLVAGTAWGAPRLAWDPNPPEEEVTHYVVFWGITSRHDPAFRGYDESRETRTTGFTLPLAENIDVTYFAAVVARNAAGLSSDYSTEVTIDIGDSSAASSGGGGGGGGGGGCFLSLLCRDSVRAKH